MKDLLIAGGTAFAIVSGLLLLQTKRLDSAKDTITTLNINIQAYEQREKVYEQELAKRNEDAKILSAQNQKLQSMAAKDKEAAVVKDCPDVWNVDVSDTAVVNELRAYRRSTAAPEN